MPVLGYSGPLSEIPTELEGDNGGDNSSAGDSNGGGDSILTDGKNGDGDSNRENGSNGSNDACSYGSSGHLANEDSDGVQGQNEVTDDSSDEVSINEQVYNNEQDVESGKLAGLILKNALDAKEQHRKFELGQRWIALDPTAKAMKEDEGPVTLQAVEFWSSICDIEENISKPDWRQREAATYAFGFVLEGPSPEKLMTLVNHALSFMLNALMKDPNNHVKDTTGWTLGRIFEFLHGSTFETPIITQANCQQIITVLLQSMRDVPNVAEKACGALYFLAQGFEDSESSSTQLTPFFQDIIQALLDVTHREDAGESRLRTAAYESLNEVVRCCTDETAPMVMQLVPLIMMELHQTLEGQRLSSDERDKQNELQGLLCGCLQVIIQKLGSSEPTKYVFMQYADQMMGLFLRVFSCKSATAHEEAMLAIGALAYSTGSDFAKYMSEFYKYLEMGLQNFEDYQVCAITVGVVGDISRALEDKILPYCDGIMTQLLKDLSSNQLHRSVKPPIFSCFGDLALAIGENFDKYLMYAMPMLQSAAELSVQTSGADDDMIEYTNTLRNGILEAYSGILQGFKGSSKSQLLMPHAPHILQFLDSLYMAKDMDDVVMKTAIGVLGDLADTLGANAAPLIQQCVSSRDFLNECLQSEDHLVREAAEWAQLAIRRAISF